MSDERFSNCLDGLFEQVNEVLALALDCSAGRIPAGAGTVARLCRAMKAASDAVDALDAERAEAVAERDEARRLYAFAEAARRGLWAGDPST